MAEMLWLKYKKVVDRASKMFLFCILLIYSVFLHQDGSKATSELSGSEKTISKKHQ